MIGKLLAKYNVGNTGALYILLTITLIPLFILSFHNHPCSDDYAEANLVIKNGFLDTQKYYYTLWIGRYFSAILISITPMVFHAYWAYKFNAIILLLLLLFSTYWLSGKLFKNLDRTGKIGIATLFLFAFIMRMPDVASGIFWESGSYTNLPAEFMTFLLLGCIIVYSKNIQKKQYFFFSCLLAIAIIGSYELTLIYIDLIVALIALISILKKRSLVFPLTLLVVCIIFSVISIKAPGNSVRAATYPNSHNLLFSIKEAVSSSVSLLIHWLPFMLLIGLLLLDLLSKSTIWNEEPGSNIFISPWLSLLASLIIPVIGLFVCYWAEGEYPPLRTVNVTYFYFVTGMMYFSFSLLSAIKKRYPDFSLPVYVKIPVYILLVFILFFRTNNITVSYRDITSGTAAAYDKERTARHEFLTTFKGDSCIIDSIKNIPVSLFFSELPRDKTSWINISFWEYYHKKYIGIKGR